MRFPSKAIILRLYQLSLSARLKLKSHIKLIVKALIKESDRCSRISWNSHEHTVTV